ncbi:bifunctional aspartate kinase/homoserine dehydrogenase I [Marinigracilibium pacificum]|uniref:Homoserine O-acetyltransferase n=1 Tax=Marinigracilibium pacificum TaxID=2729599 RepID=A0A848ISH4_9BACT|nr:bifunctional aspartate kinase/homoserine dehydrogenase I [Marinigracilibium pacificum]NMM47297.1 bifunctional aspartate kinase/homoserine dehydrogenase I [Marinigracilibium pacificum]
MSDLKKFVLADPFEFENGESIEGLTVAYQTFGKLNENKTNVIWVCHAISGSSNVIEWWPGLFGDGTFYDPENYFIICANSIGSPYGSTKPESLDFPQFSIRDVVNAYFYLADHLGISHIHTLIGGSFGGNQALEFAYGFNGKIDHLVLIASCSKESAWGIAVHESQRMAMLSDPTFGTKDGGKAGMKAARSMALLTYRTSDAFIEKQTDTDEKVDNFKSSSYLQYQGDKFINRFNALSYYYLTKCLDSHNIGRNRGGEVKALSEIDIPTLVIGIDTDSLIPTRFQQFIAEHIPNATYREIKSDYGHDGFLIEIDQIVERIESFYIRNQPVRNDQRKVLKFGGKSLKDSAILENVLSIIQTELENNPIAVVVSARGDSTDRLLELYECAGRGESYEEKLEMFFNDQILDDVKVDLEDERMHLNLVLQAIQTLGYKARQVEDKVVAIGELISAKVISAFLQKHGVQAISVDARDLIVAEHDQGDVEVDFHTSREKVQQFFSQLDLDQVPIITGFLAGTSNGETITLGRNGSNYTATLIASFINASEVQNWTDIDGVYSASPKYVSHAMRLDHISYREANELANFGANVLHPKTIQPLLFNNIPLRIKSTWKPEDEGTLIDKTGSEKGVKAVSSIEGVSLVSIDGKGMLGKVGIDARIFNALSKQDISVRLISQASSERGIGFVVDSELANEAELALTREFNRELESGDISSIRVNNDMAIIAIVGRHNFALERAIQGLRKNKIWMYLISNSISGEHISLVISNKNIRKAMNVVHNQVFGAIKTINLFAIGKGVVGGALIDQIVNTAPELIEERGMKVNVIGVADSRKYVFNENGLNKEWRSSLAASDKVSYLPAILKELFESGLENVVIADNTSSAEITEAYPTIVKHGFDIVASNKKANSSDYLFYSELRKLLKRRSKKFYYEANVGAGLPLIDTLRSLKHSSDQITKIKGIFSGSLSYLFNKFSIEDVSFSDVLLEAKEAGFTEPDPREDLDGMDVARKLLILAREIGLSKELEDVEVQSLIPEELRDLPDFDSFISKKEDLDLYYGKIKNDLPENEVLRYVGELDVVEGKLIVSLVNVDKNSPLGALKNADSIFEVYTSGYGDHPFIIQGAGAGAEVTARGVYSDILKIGIQL